MKNHLARIAVMFAALVIGATFGPAAIAAASASLFFAAFAAQHDLAHGALRLPRRIRELALSAVGALLLMSGHATRTLHLRHHSRLFAEDDLEGSSAKLSLLRAIWAAPVLAIRMRLEALSSVHGRERRFVVVEYLLNAMTVLAMPALCGEVGAIYAAIAVSLQIAMPVWAGHIPHRAPVWAVAIARRLAFTRSPTMLSLAYHDLHHEHPRVPTAELGVFASAVPDCK